MKRLILIVIILLKLTLTTQAQKDKSDQFNFWIGEWNIEQKILDQNGEWLEYKASTEVKYILKKQAIEEHWNGNVKFFWEGMEKPMHLEGYSLRYYDQESDQWLIYWMDSLHPALKKPFAGNFTTDNHGEFFRTTNTSGNETIAKITFDRIDENTVNWKLEINSDSNSWKTLWIMHMKRK